MRYFGRDISTRDRIYGRLHPAVNTTYFPESGAELICFDRDVFSSNNVVGIHLTANGFARISPD
jgi:hypothetical protein